MLINVHWLGRRLLFAPESGADVAPGSGGGDGDGSTAVADAPPIQTDDDDGPLQFADPDDDDEFPSPSPGGGLDIKTPAPEDTGADDSAGTAGADDTAAQDAGEGGDSTATGSEAAPALDPELIEVAESMGVPKPLARQFETNRELADYLKTLRPGGSPFPQGQTPAQKAEEVPFTLPTEVEQQLKQMEEEGVGSDVISAFRSTHEVHGKQLAAVTRQTEQLQTLLHQTLQKAAHDRFDQRITAMGQETLFGKGSIEDLDPKSPEFSNRIQHFREFEKLLANGMDEKRAFRTAYHSVFGDQQAKLAREEVAHRAEKFEKQRTTPPTQRQSKPLSTREAAAQRANKFYADRGLLDRSIANFDDDV